MALYRQRSFYNRLVNECHFCILRYRKGILIACQCFDLQRMHLFQNESLRLGRKLQNNLRILICINRSICLVNHFSLFSLCGGIGYLILGLWRPFQL